MSLEIGAMKPKARAIAILIVIFLSVALGSPRARADAIDGHWCSKDGKRLSIDGPLIVTPGGRRMEGNYDRHAFSYKVPRGEPQAGALSAMVQLNEEIIQVQTGNGPTLTWNRCAPPIS